MAKKTPLSKATTKKTNTKATDEPSKSKPGGKVFGFSPEPEFYAVGDRRYYQNAQRTLGHAEPIPRNQPLFVFFRASPPGTVPADVSAELKVFPAGGDPPVVTPFVPQAVPGTVDEFFIEIPPNTLVDTTGGGTAMNRLKLLRTGPPGDNPVSEIKNILAKP